MALKTAGYYVVLQLEFLTSNTSQDTIINWIYVSNIGRPHIAIHERSVSRAHGAEDSTLQYDRRQLRCCVKNADGGLAM